MKDNNQSLIIGLLIIFIILNYYSTKISNEYESDKSIFCGIKALPRNYGRYGNRYECLKRGFGAGMYRNEKNYPYRKCGIFIIITVIGIMIYNYYNNYKKEKEKEKEKYNIYK